MSKKPKKMTLYPKMVQVLHSPDRLGLFLQFAADADKGQPAGEQIDVFVSDGTVDKLMQAFKVYQDKKRISNEQTKH